jgi:peptidylprolyl isomerase/FKBP-type peptidyl-prolyl cis-trans isomerase FklB
MLRTVTIFAVTAALGLAACHRSLPDQSKASEAFLQKTAKQPGVRALPDGLLVQVVRSGPVEGLRPQSHDEVKVNYEGKLIDGTVFDSTYERGQPAAFQVGGVIKGWQEALKLMRPGDEWIVYVPPKLGYGDKGAGQIPPNAALIFRIELIAVLPAEERLLTG